MFFADMRQQRASQVSGRPGHLDGMVRRFGRLVPVFLCSVLCVPLSASGETAAPAASARRPAPAVASTSPSPGDQLRLIDANCAALKNEYAKRTAELADTLERLAESMARLGEMRVEYEESGALLSASARDVAACEADRAVKSQDLGRCTVAAKALEAKLVGYEKKLAELEMAASEQSAGRDLNKQRLARLEDNLRVAQQKAGLIAGLEKELQVQRKLVSSQGEENAKLKQEFIAAKSQANEQAKGQQRALASLKNEKENQIEIIKKLVREVQKNTSRLVELESRLADKEQFE